ncbi:MAG: hypothetical protein AAF420_14455, partial [Pseudomonadota bacterium]
GIVAHHLAAGILGIALARAPASDRICAQCNLTPCLEHLAVPSQQEYFLVYPTHTGLSQSARQFRDWILAETQDPDDINFQ